MAKLGIISGGGQFPLLVARGAKSMGHFVAAVAFDGHSNMDIAGETDAFKQLNLGQLGKLISFFKDNGVEQVAMAGSINKPKALGFKPDFRAAKLVMKAVSSSGGDASILGLIIRELESEGFTVVPPHEFTPEIVTPSGVLTKRKPNSTEKQDLELGLEVAKTVGKLDIGQCVVVKKKIVAAVEAMEGTDAAIRRGSELAGKGACVVKVFKPGQQRRADMPSVGLKTIELMAETGAKCLGIEAGASLFFDMPEAVKLADKNSITIVGL